MKNDGNDFLGTYNSDQLSLTMNTMNNMALEMHNKPVTYITDKYDNNTDKIGFHSDKPGMIKPIMVNLEAVTKHDSN